MVAAGVLVAPAGLAFAGAVTLPRPVVGSVTDVNRAFAELMVSSGMSEAEMCLELTNTVAATHVLDSSVSDQTLYCAVPSGMEEATQLERYAALVRGVRTNYARVTNGWYRLSENRDLYNLLRAWAENLTRCGDPWLTATLGPIDFPPYQASPTFAAEVMDTWDRCVAADATPPDPGTDPGTGTGADPGAGDPPPVVPTYLEQVIDRLDDNALIRRGRTPGPAQSRKAARACIKAEVAARAAGVIGPDERPCLEEPVFFPGADAGYAALHDAQAIAERPEWAKLTYISGADKRASGVEARWYTLAANRTPACPPKPAERGKNCDEYPFFTTVEGGPGASLQEVPADENRAEGSALRRMYSDPNGQMEGVGSESTRFFVVSLAVPLGVPGTPDLQFTGPPSMHVCLPGSGAPGVGGGMAS